MLRLGRRSRGALAAAGLSAFALAYATTPLLAGGDRAPLAAEPPPVPAATPAPGPAVAVSPRRDPFAGMPEAPASLAPNAAPPTVAIPTLPPLPRLPSWSPTPGTIAAIPGIARLLPPNAGAALGALPRDGVRVTALITGTRPSAIVEDQSGTRVVTLGDVLGGDRISAIDAAGIHVARGTIYPIAPAAQPAQPHLSPQLTSPGGLP